MIRDEAETWDDDERRALMAKIEEGFLQAERGELIDSEQARAELDSMKELWRRSRRG
jgi:hypothetical protein